ncbi:MAG: hypothetical protein CMF99_00635 [Candidatus Marinimicrobia bacterium]|nr:hypothetical protein [Candidatus Neomarinimicrobiota bacterium]
MENMASDRRLEIFGILIISVSVFLLFSFLGYNPNEEPSISPNVKIENPMGILGLIISHIFVKLGFGYVMIVIPIFGMLWGWTLFAKKDYENLIKISQYGILFIFLFSVSLGFILTIFSPKSHYLIPGLLGSKLAYFFVDWLSKWGTFIFILASYLALLRGFFNIDFYAPFPIISAKINNLKNKFGIFVKEKKKEKIKRRHTLVLKEKIGAKTEREQHYNHSKIKKKLHPEKSDIKPDNVNSTDRDDSGKAKGEINPESTGFKPSDPLSLNENQETESLEVANKGIKNEEASDLNIEEIIENEELEIDDIKERKKPKRKYQLPSSDLLANPVAVSDTLSRDELVERANYLTQSMSTFGVQGKVVNVHPGPVITLFEVEPAEGVRVNKFVQLADDLARVMEASSVRVIAPIPGKSSVGIEIPNRNPATVYFKSVVNSPEFIDANSLLTLAIGKTTSGEISTLDLAKMPHLLIAGTTGSGKSVCINTIICSILYTATPDEVKFVMIDPKKVEMTLYKRLEGYHLLKMEDIPEPIVTSVDNAILALRALEKEMDRRYNILADAVVRNIGEYNLKMIKNGEPIMPYIVLVVDELADLMMLSAKDVEAPIARLAQLARAVGIHLVIATQRPSVDVITGVIKANFPSRIAFQVASKIDSRTIIDQPGADKLIGRGDMLHLGTGSSDVFRMHNAFLSLEEIEALMDHVSDQTKPEELILPSVRESQTSEFGSNEDYKDIDELFQEAVALVITHQQGSISLLQRRLKIGYSRAARLIDEMEKAAVVGPFTGSKAREVLVDETYLEIIKET